MPYDPSDVLLRAICGLFLIPHLTAKIRHPEASVDLFRSIGLRPPRPWIAIAAAVETIIVGCMILNVFVRPAAVTAAALLLIAAVAVLRATGGKWRWNVGGAEYPLFWCLCFIVVALRA